jgi:hypothetical protein
MRSSDALRVAREVQTGATRSYVQAALELAAYVIEQESMRRPPPDGEDVPSVRPAAPSGSDSNAEPVVPEGKIGDILSVDDPRSHRETSIHNCPVCEAGPGECGHDRISALNAAVKPTVYPVPTPVPPTNRHPASCQCPSCLYGHICKVCQTNYTTSEYCSWQCAQGKPVK